MYEPPTKEEFIELCKRFNNGREFAEDIYDNHYDWMEDWFFNKIIDYGKEKYRIFDLDQEGE